MDSFEILKKVIEKAVENGWRWLSCNKKQTLEIWNNYNCKGAISRGDYYFVIFSLSFAKAFWGTRVRI